MPRGGKRSSAWKPGESPVKKKGSKNKTTILKEAFGVNNWNQLTGFVESQGLERLMLKMNRLKPKDYCTVYLALTEFVKPKLQRTTIEGDVSNPFVIKVTRK